jgi:hypothetical protein
MLVQRRCVAMPTGNIAGTGSALRSATRNLIHLVTKLASFGNPAAFPRGRSRGEGRWLCVPPFPAVCLYREADGSYPARHNARAPQELLISGENFKGYPFRK